MRPAQVCFPLPAFLPTCPSEFKRSSEPSTIAFDLWKICCNGSLIKIPDRISERPPRGGLSVCASCLAGSQMDERTEERACDPSPPNSIQLPGKRNGPSGG